MRVLTVLALMMTATGLVGCADHPHPHARVREPGFYVPTTAIVQSGWRNGRAQPGQVLPASDGDYDFPRAEKVVYGATSLGDSSSYTTYTYDAQAIGIPGTGNYGYRFRWVVQQGVSSP